VRPLTGSNGGCSAAPVKRKGKKIDGDGGRPKVKKMQRIRSIPCLPSQFLQGVRGGRGGGAPRHSFLLRGGGRAPTK
jgi:hypothetical protein